MSGILEEARKYAAQNSRPPWYEHELKDLSIEARRLLEQYSGIPADEVDGHILALRDRAFDIFPYPCIGSFRFLQLSLVETIHYNEILQRVKAGEKFLDAGCCFGQELRQLAFDGAPEGNLYGTDISLDFMNLGYDLFLDKDRFKARFIAADIFDDNSDLVKELTGQIDIIYAGSFLHLFGKEDSFKVAKRLVSLLKDKPNALILGRQVGNIDPGEQREVAGEKSIFRHNEASWIEFWHQVGEETGVKWKVEASLVSGLAESTWKWHKDKNVRLLKFAVRRE
ncbi:hypothetical protein BGW36DRAFT_301111 [Talaromyces proteolyticus]|uniref:Methyltransferase domain-containing protein n=1 Tax=Talaromyces proteolyticus TaxID=1131652 RepID=A0AAD4PVN6_9EURO|nr:uncharacterized protein BGW36DRAFT_301111 [Talaromyces proteolyticus]KAH8693712.1 hypothetical protein BGW36DRAFT_301111 [Talaromyces proteolyticus]